MVGEEYRRYEFNSRNSRILEGFLESLVETGLAAKLFNPPNYYIGKVAYGEVVIACLEIGQLELFGYSEAVGKMAREIASELEVKMELKKVFKATKSSNMGLPQ